MGRLFELADCDFSEKQIALVEYLLSRLGFQEDSTTDRYLRKLIRTARLFKNNRAIMIDSNMIDRNMMDNPSGLYYQFEDRYLPRRYNIIDFLIDEYKIKKNKNYIIIENQSSQISATDLANFTFCPVGYSLSRSFKIPELISAVVGSKLHDEKRIIGIKSFLEETKTLEPGELIKDVSLDERETIYTVVDSKNKSFFEDIMKGKLIYSGHNNTYNANNLTTFKNSELNFVGQPDYVFENQSGENFVIEEKYMTTVNSASEQFYNNHLMQLASYIYFLIEIKAHYGYLVYWKRYLQYDEHGYFTETRKCLIMKVIREKKYEDILLKTFSDVKLFMEKKYFNLSNEMLIPEKCAGCAFSMYCGHKNRRRNQVSLPYQRGYHNLYQCRFPEILIRKDESIQNTNNTLNMEELIYDK